MLDFLVGLLQRGIVWLQEPAQEPVDMDVDEGDGGFVSAPDPSVLERRSCLTQAAAASFR